MLRNLLEFKPMTQNFQEVQKLVAVLEENLIV